ncbi:TetR/AcrR family transcriptional regulator [Secundilactobacillus paracollinoides]|uniref:HTH tetR-type domain-containing protein n=1 Tax=Secundilactobacillus paracollinoides TaxID=240427 RepID=A0A1B2IYC6_9LACO|nr:TetR/AcrR family transcriptional regulator [Secundilactobacillus paracollinoides]ANZ61108.1 hypothetical protein AYR61_06980 [Secundilactobacillus paracollinoides]ANZ67029.1 hypothetical protein AYR63_07725 [Secundilactobacillus paracollinoides]
MTAEDHLITAFLDLLAVEDYNKISVSQLMNRVHLTRTYFYQLYSDKSELAREAFFSLIREYLLGISQAITKNGTANERAVQQGMQFISVHRDQMQLLMQVQKGDFNLLTEFQDRIKTIIVAEVSKSRQVSAPVLDYFSDLFAASTITTLNWFLTHDEVSTDEMIRLASTSLSQGVVSIL